MGFASSVWRGGGSSEPVPVRVVRGYFVFVFYISSGWRVAESEIDRWPGARVLYRQGYSKKNHGKRKIDFVDVILRISEALVCVRASGDNFLRSITRAIVNKNVGKRKIDFLTLF